MDFYLNPYPIAHAHSPPAHAWSLSQIFKSRTMHSVKKRNVKEIYENVFSGISP